MNSLQMNKIPKEVNFILSLFYCVRVCVCVGYVCVCVLCTCMSIVYVCVRVRACVSVRVDN